MPYDTIIRILFVLSLIFVGGKAMAVEEAPYQVVMSSGMFEVREYARTSWRISWWMAISKMPGTRPFARSSTTSPAPTLIRC